jgi:rhodanese-related sulfurtransferase
MNQPAPIPSVDVKEAERRLREDEAAPLIVDVREPDEHVAGRVDTGAVLMPMSTFAQRMHELPKDRPLLMLCASGNRSSAATAHLLRNGWTDVSNVAGGITEWQQAGLPVRRGPIAPDEGSVGPGD